MHKVFISYHHKNDQWAKDQLVKWAEKHDIFIDGSVDTGDIPDNWSDEKIREQIRDEYLRDTTVTIVLVGTETKNRKHIDWEIYSSMYDGKKNKKSGIIVIYLPSVEDTGSVHVGHGQKEKNKVHPDINNWVNVDSWAEYERRHPYLPARIIDNLMVDDSHISVLKWENIVYKIGDYSFPDVEKLKSLIDYAYEDRQVADYDLSRQMRRRNG